MHISHFFRTFATVTKTTLTMRITITKPYPGRRTQSFNIVEFSEFTDLLLSNAQEGDIRKYREAFPTLPKGEQWERLKRMKSVCPACEWSKTRNGQHFVRKYNGISMLTVQNLTNKLQIDLVKTRAELIPQTICAFEGADGQSVHIWTLASLPDGSLPENLDAMELFHAQAYAISVMCYAPTLGFPITIEEPRLDHSCILSLDMQPYVNPHPTAFIIPQPTEGELRLLRSEIDNDLQERFKPTGESYVTLTRIFNAAYKRARLEMKDWHDGKNQMAMVVRVAEKCADCNFPEEEAVTRLHQIFHNFYEDEIRGTVNNIYTNRAELPHHKMMSKHQLIAYRLREFLDRRYDIRYNQVLQMTEFRRRNSLDFLFRELDRRELNTIHHEACLEGIEPTFGEVDQLVHSNRIALYDPIQEYLGQLPKWDGKDHIGQLAAMVPTNHPQWERLFGRWFLSMVAHWMTQDTTHANQTAPILIGAQGYRKSTFARLILPPELRAFFTDSIDFRSNTEAERCLSRFLLVNIDEFDQLSEKQFAYVKHLFQKPQTNIRRMYSETIGTQRRYASFIGTSNQQEILRDPTGNRRYICVTVTAPIHVERAINYLQLYAQAVSLIQQGERYWLNDDDEAIIQQSNKDYETQTPLEDILLATYDMKPTKGVWLHLTEIMERLQKHPAFNRKRDNNLYQLGRALTKHKVQKSRDKHGIIYQLLPLT